MNEVVRTAREWIGTPYRHQGTTKGVGCDCLGLIRGVWRTLYGAEPEEPGPYGTDWAERSGQERLLEAARRHFGPPVSRRKMLPGDLLLFRWCAGMAAKHAGILSGADRFIHAYEQAGVIESALVPGWERRIAGVFRFPPLANNAISAQFDCIDGRSLPMASMTIRNIDEALKSRLRVRAARHGRSMEDEARDILKSALAVTEPEMKAGLIFSSRLSGRVLPFDVPAAEIYAATLARRKAMGRSMTQFDAQIAAIALSRGASLATRNVADFMHIDLDVINLWDYRG